MESDAWCLLSLGGEEVKAKILHVGRGRFRITADESGRYVGKIIDASDILHCKFGSESA